VKAIAKTRPEAGIEIIDMKEPSPGAHEVVYSLGAAAICGSDLTMYRWDNWAPGTVKPLPVVLGHEMSGTVVAVGKGVEAFKPGDRISAETHISCGKCWYCRNDRSHVCSNMVLFGHNVNGCFSEFGLINERAVWKIESDVPLELAAMMEPLGVAMRGAEAVDLQDQPVAIIGAGPIGQMVAAVASTRGAQNIIVIEPCPGRRKLALEVGADVAIDPGAEDPVRAILELTDGIGVEVVIDCSGSVDAIIDSIRYTRTCGHLVMIGNPHVPITIDGLRDIVHKELHIQGHFGRRIWQTWGRTEAFALKYPEKLARIATARYPLIRGHEAFEKALDGTQGKILLLPS